MAFDFRSSLDDLLSGERARQDHAFGSLTAATSQTVDWSYEVWDELLRLIATGDNRQRAIAAQLLCNLAASDPEGRMLRHMKALVAVTRDERFVTARHCLQALWKVGVAGPRQRVALVKLLVQRFKECEAEKNCTLIRYDILVVIRRLYDETGAAELRATADTLAALEQDPRYRKKYAALWRG